MGRRDDHEDDDEEGSIHVYQEMEPDSAWVLPRTPAPQPTEKTETTV